MTLSVNGTCAASTPNVICPPVSLTTVTWSLTCSSPDSSKVRFAVVMVTPSNCSRSTESSMMPSRLSSVSTSVDMSLSSAASVGSSCSATPSMSRSESELSISLTASCGVGWPAAAVAVSRMANHQTLAPANRATTTATTVRISGVRAFGRPVPPVGCCWVGGPAGGTDQDAGCW